jgi:hypothetical protein
LLTQPDLAAPCPQVVAMEQVPQQQELASVDWQSLKASAAQAQQLEEAKPAASAFSVGSRTSVPVGQEAVAGQRFRPLSLSGVV